MGLNGFEPLTSPLSGVRSNQLSYRPAALLIIQGTRAITDTHEAGGDARLPPLTWEIRCLHLSLIVG